MTGKGDRWGRTVRQVCTRLSGCQHDCTPPTYLHGKRQDNFVAAVVSLRGRPTAGCLFEACAGRRVRRLCPPAVPVLQAVCLLSPFACHAHCPHHLPPSSSCPVHCCCALPLFHFHVRQDRRVRASSLQAARTVLLAAATRACSGGPCTGRF